MQFISWPVIVLSLFVAYHCGNWQCIFVIIFCLYIIVNHEIYI